MQRLFGLSVLMALLAAAAPAHAQFPAAPAGGSHVELDPIRCWWRTSTGAVRIGEIFDLSLTCAVLDSDAVQVIPDESRLDSASIQFAPFEVVSGTHPANLHSGGRRFFQYHYRLRVISPDAVDRDMALPPVAIHYTINNRVAANASVQGRDLVYLLPQFLMRVSSMVPATATDIRDAAGVDFGSVDEFLFRAGLLDIVAVTCIVLAVLVVVVALIAWLRRGTTRTAMGEQLLTTGQLVAAARSELRNVSRDRTAEGWSEALAARALAATRLVATCAIGAQASQRPADATTTAGEGRLLHVRPFKRRARVLSGSATAADMTRAIEAAAVDAARTPLLESLRDALTTFAATQYRRESVLDQAALDTALASAESAAAQVRREHAWWKTLWQSRRHGSPLAAPSRA